MFANRPNRLGWHHDECQTRPSVFKGLGRIGSLILSSARRVYSAIRIGRIGSNTGRIGLNTGRIGLNAHRPNRLEQKKQSVQNLEIRRFVVRSLGAISALLATCSPAECLIWLVNDKIQLAKHQICIANHKMFSMVSKLGAKPLFYPPLHPLVKLQAFQWWASWMQNLYFTPTPL